MAKTLRRAGAMAAVVTALSAAGSAQAQQVVTAQLSYQAPGGGPRPNFSPKGTQVPLSDAPAAVALPAGSTRPARIGTIRIGPGETSWVRVLAAADADHPKDLCRIVLDRNRNGDFTDDGAALVAAPTVREKTGAVWTSFNGIEVSVPYGPAGSNAPGEPYLFSIWLVREGGDVPGVLRYSAGSWRAGSVTIGGVEALVAAMDSNNDAVFDREDMWSVLEASAADAPKRVLSYEEARPTSRLMFAKTPGKELVLEFRAFSPDGGSVSFAVVDRPVTRAADRAGDDTVREERGRPRATTPIPWGTNFEAALAAARRAGKPIVVDFWTTWCGPCRTMDEWVWSDAEVASAVGSGYVAVKLDGDVEKTIVERYSVAGFPTTLVLGPDGRETGRAVGYQSSKQVLDLLAPRR